MDPIDALKSAVKHYATAKCKTEIVNLNVIEPPGGVVNTGDIFQFSVRIINHGELDMKNVKVQVNATEYAGVMYGTHDYFVTTPGSGVIAGGSCNLDAGQVYTKGSFYGKSMKKTLGAKDIVTAQISSWDASLDHILLDHSGGGAAEGKLHLDVVDPPIT